MENLATDAGSARKFWTRRTLLQKKNFAALASITGFQQSRTCAAPVVSAQLSPCASASNTDTHHGA
jgi:hypothetical protein